MKKRSLVLVLVMAVIMLITGCAKEEVEENPFVGTWTGSVDMTQQVVDSMVAQDSNLQKYAKFENLVYTFVFEFSEENLSLCIDEASKQQFITNMEIGVADMVDAMVADVAVEHDTTIEAVYAGMGVTRDQYVQHTIEAMKFDAMVNDMAKALELNGSYEYDEKSIVVLYEDNTYEEMKYALGKEMLTITVSDGTNEFSIPCTKEK